MADGKREKWQEIMITWFFLLLAFAAYVMLNLSNKNLCQISSHRPFHSYGQTLT